MVKGVKFRAYPNKEQQNLINRTLGCSRMIYNKGLSMRNIAYAAGDKIGYNQTSSMLTELKKQEEYAFLKEVDSIALQQSLRDLDRGFKNFFAKRAAHPRFKSKHDHHQSYRTMNQSNNIRITGRYIKLPKLGYIKIRQSMEIGHINHVTIERTPTGKHFVILNVDFDPELRPNAGGKIGIDVGIKAFYSDSNGNTVSNPKYLEKSARKLIREQRKACADHKKAESDHAKELDHCKTELQLTHEKAILELEQKYQATIQKLKEEKQAEIDKYQQKYFDLLEKNIF